MMEERECWWFEVRYALLREWGGLRDDPSTAAD